MGVRAPGLPLSAGPFMSHDRRDGWRDVVEGVVGAGAMIASGITPFLRPRRNRWGLDTALAGRPLAGDDLVPRPRWSWTHGIEIDASADAVWPWVAQVGADRGGFYSYQWLENIAGCGVRNATRCIRNGSCKTATGWCSIRRCRRCA